MITIALSWPASRLGANNSIGRSWQATRAARVEYKREAFAATLEVIQTERYSDSARYSVIVTFHPPDRRKRDVDNLFHALKSAIDGVASAMRINDSQFVEYRLRIAKPVKGGMVLIDIVEMRQTDWDV